MVYFISLSTLQPAGGAQYLFIASYHQGYAGSDGVARGIRAGLGKRCPLKPSLLDTAGSSYPKESGKKTKRSMRRVRAEDTTHV
jgi:hypothetical protein